MEQKSVGRFQIELGLLILIAAVVIGVVVCTLALNRFSSVFLFMTKYWGDVAASGALEKEVVTAHIMSYAGIFSLLYFFGFLMILLFLLTLSLIGFLFISQGTANINLSADIKNAKISISEAKIKSKHLFKIFLILLLAGSFLYFEPVQILEVRDLSGEIVFRSNFGFPSNYLTFEGWKIVGVNLIGLIINIFFVFMVSLAVSLIYLRYILGVKILKEKR